MRLIFSTILNISPNYFSWPCGHAGGVDAKESAVTRLQHCYLLKEKGKKKQSTIITTMRDCMIKDRGIKFSYSLIS